MAFRALTQGALKYYVAVSLTSMLLVLYYTLAPVLIAVLLIGFYSYGRRSILFLCKLSALPLVTFILLAGKNYHLFGIANTSSLGGGKYADLCHHGGNEYPQAKKLGRRRPGQFIQTVEITG